MINIRDNDQQKIDETIPTNHDRLEHVAQEVCDRALTDAREQLHPLLQQVELDRLDKRREFLKAFKSALEQEIAKRIVKWTPAVRAVYRFDAPGWAAAEHWDGTIHLLVVVPQLLKPIRKLGEKLDQTILTQLRRLHWGRFQRSRSMIEIQQVTMDEMRHRVGYGAMFLSVYAAPVRVWPAK